MPPPSNRALPRSVMWRLLLSGPLNQVAWLLLGIGLIPGWVVVSSVDLSFVHYWGAIERTTGTIMDLAETGVSINHQPVLANAYRFIASDGRHFEDYSYATGRWYNDGEQVSIEYPRGKPHLLRIQNMSRKSFGPLGLLFAIGPVVGLSFLAFRVRRALQTRYLLQRGVLTRGVLVDKEATNMTVNNATVYKLTFAFTANDGQEYHVVRRTHETGPLEDEQAERLLYDPSCPQTALLVDALPGMPTFDDNGQIRPQPVSLISCILPALVLGGHGIYALSTLW